MGRSQGSRAGLNRRPTNQTLSKLPTKDAQKVWKREQLREIKRINSIADPAKRAYERSELRRANAQGLARLPKNRRSDQISWDTARNKPAETRDSLSLSERERALSQPNITRPNGETRGRPSGNLNRPRLGSQTSLERRRKALARLQRIWLRRAEEARRRGERFTPPPIWRE
jgi:hypothetical protein